MDYEYLQNVMGSPYVNEGSFSRLKAKGAQAMQAGAAMAGYGLQDPTETKLRSLWDGFVFSLKPIMKDWKDYVSPMLNDDISLDGNSQNIKMALDNLSRVFVSQIPNKAGSFKNNYNVPSPRNQRDDPETYGDGSQDSSKLKHLAEAGMWNRDMGLNAAVASNNPTKILDSYKNKILSLFKNFMSDAIKSTGIGKQQIYSLLAKIQPSKSGYQAPANMQKVVQQLQKLQSIGNVNPQAAPGEVPPVINPPSVSNPAAESPIPPTPPKDSSPATTHGPNNNQPSPTIPNTSGNKDMSGFIPQGGGIPGGPLEVKPEELPFIILKAIKIIIDAVKSDVGHSGKYFTTAQLPVGGGGHSLTKEITSPPKHKSGTEVETGDSKPEDVKEIPGEFLYNFHSKLRKTPTSNFSIQVKPVKESPEVEGLPGSYKIQVWWNNEGHKNNIYVVAESQGKKSEPILIMHFFDNEVSSESGAITPGDVSFFTVDKIVKASNPNVQSKLASALPQVREEIKKLENQLLRSLMATTGRKFMEWKAKTKKVFPVTYDEKGNVTFTDKDGKKSLISKENVGKILGSDYETSEKWKETLDHYGYFDEFPDMKPKEIEDYPEFKDAQTKMLQGGFLEPAANKLLYSAWMQLAETKPKEEITSDELVSIAKGEANGESEISPEESFKQNMENYPALKDAYLAATKLNLSPKSKGAPKSMAEASKIAASVLSQVWDELKSVKNPEEITSDELVQASLKKKSITPAKAKIEPAPTQTATNDAPTSPVSSPVSGTATGSEPITNPTAPVSTNNPEPDKGQGQKLQQPTVPKGEDSDESNKKYGKVDIKGTNIEWEHPKTHEVHTLNPDQVVNFAHKVPKFLAALKQNPDVYKQYKEKIDVLMAKKGANKGQKPMKEDFTFINPFNRDNFLL